MRLVICLLWALDIHGDDQVVLCTQVDREHVGLLDPDAVLHAFNYRLHHNVNTMQCAPDVQHIVVDAIDEAGDDANMMAHHGVLVVRRHADQLGTPLNVQCVHELGDQIENG